ncbi:MAG: hypothetical protein K6G42_09770 [Lachnospiraceae bacterium]|nr:hypothetical protein [Lachnospiraceae bacterium]
MGMMDSLKSAGSTAKTSFEQNTGSVEKAIIEVIDLSGRETEKAEAVAVVGKTMGKRPANSFVDKSLLGDEMKSLKLLGDGQYLEDKVNVASNKRKYFTVQFNPSTLQISGHGGGLQQEMDYGGDPKEGPHRSASYVRGGTYISMSVSLLFDSCDPQNAFLEDKLIPNVSSVGAGVAKAITSAMGKKTVSIQKQVEGFISALRNQYTRIVTFHWGELNYSGILQNIGANYTMFNINGEPIRATVDISIVSADDERWKNSLTTWQTKYIKSFTKSESFVKASQKVGGLLNLNVGL